MEEFDQFVSSLTPRQDNEAIKTYQNTVAIACPACDEPFDDMIVCKRAFNTLELDRRMDLCTTVHDDNVVLFTHKS